MCSPGFTAGWDIMNKSLREKIMQWFDGRDKKIDNINWTTQNKEKTDASSVYYFRNVIH